ncbi:MAG TPA: universal stress protein [Bryobacteraceae bacterium]|nr:universal stress protein [Bryobacteraceae bacterium]
MFQLRRILFPVDFSSRCHGAAGYVQSLAGRFDAELILLHVIEATYNMTLEDLRVSRARKFESFFDPSLKHLRYRTIVEYGEAAVKIIEYATAQHVDLIMIPTQGMGIYRRLILGSTSAKVLHDADCPVWTGVHLEDAPPLEAVAWQRILCAVDLKPSGARVLDWAAHLADEYQAELTLVHVLSGNHSQHACAEARQALEHLQAAAGSRAAIRVEKGDVAKVISHLSAELKTDLLIIGRGEEAGVLGRLKMVSYSLIRQSPCPVVSV